MICWTGLAPWEYEFPFPGSLIYTFLRGVTPLLEVAEKTSKERGTLLSQLARHAKLVACNALGDDFMSCFRRDQERSPLTLPDPIAANVYGEYSAGPSIRPICTRCCSTMINMI